MALAVAGWCALSVVLATIAVVGNGDRVRDFGWTAVRQHGAYVLRVTRDGPASAALQTGDVVVAFNGDRRVARWPATAARAFLPGTTPYTISVQRGDRELTLTLAPVVRRAPGEFRLSFWLLVDGLVWCVLVCLIALRSRLPVARIAFAAGVAVGLFYLKQATGLAAPFQPYAVGVLLCAIFPLWPLHLAFGYDFYVRFPRSERPPRVIAWIRAGVYVTCGLLAGRSLAFTILAALGPEPYFAFRALTAPLEPLANWTDIVAEVIISFGLLAALAHNYRHVERADDRRRLRWIVWGTAVGIAPFTAINVGRALLPWVPALAVVNDWVLVGNITTVVIPFSVGYAIVRHQVFDITFVIRKGLQYLLAKNALRTLLLLPVGALGYGLVVHRNEPVGQLVLQHSLYIYASAAALAALRFRTSVTRWVDRRFFREAYDRERLLLGLLDDVAALDSASGVSKLVSRELEAAFHPRCLFIWYRDAVRPDLTLSYSSGGCIRAAELRPDSPLVVFAGGAGDIVHARTDAAAGALPAADREWLEESDVELIVPIVAQDREVLGLLMLGGKRSEEPYSADDLRVLQALAHEIALARENARLKDRVDEDRRVRHDVLARLDSSRVRLLRECPSCGSCYDGEPAACPADGAELALSLPIERIIEGKYRLDRLIGKGGMGAVYEAADLRLGRQVAVKVLLGRAFGDRQALRRFEREAHAAARLEHPNIVRVYDYGAVGAEGAYLVMEIVPGPTLRRELQQHGACPPAAAGGWFAQIGAGVAAAHAHGIVHRDLKPENVILAAAPGEAPCVKIVDFGLAKIEGGERDATTELTCAGAVMGTVGYMAPEQLTGAAIDARTDIFALGVMAAEIVTGIRPFEGPTIGELLVSMTRPLRLAARGTEWRRLEGTLQRATAERASDRYQSVDAFLADLLPAFAGLDAPQTALTAAR